MEEVVADANAQPRHLQTLAKIRENQRKKLRTGVMFDVPAIGFDDAAGDPLPQRRRKLARIADQVHDCRLCPLAGLRLDRAWVEGCKVIGADQLERTVTMARGREDQDERVYYERYAKAVPGQGPANARVMVVGEAPGFYEEQASLPGDPRFGIPFVGPSGKELGRMLERAGIQREEAYVTNVVRCRPPENRDPAENEMRPCAHGLLLNGRTQGAFLRRQIAVVRPWLIIIMGRLAAQTILQVDEGVGQLRGKVYDYPWSNRLGVPIRCTVTYHPAALLRNWTQGIPVHEEDWAMIAAMIQQAVAKYGPLTRET